MRLNLSTYGGALADPEYVRMVAPQFGPRKTVANMCVCLRASEQINSASGSLFTGKVGSDLVRVRRISDLYNPT